jgi:uncharacterized protein (DUF58 family)
VRRIDWNVTARSGEPFLKLYREERELTLLLVLDVSGSVRFGSGGRDGRTDKRLQIARLAGGLAYAALRSGDRVGLLTFADEVRHFLPPRRSRGHGWQVIRTAFEDAGQAGGTDLAAALTYAARVLRRRAVVVVLSDFWSGGGRWTAADGPLARRHRVHGLLVHDAAEARLDLPGLVTLQDAETGEVRTRVASELRAATPVRTRLDELRRAGLRASAISTADDAFTRLTEHFRGGR